jgi:sensor histidine kinase YesM
LIAIGLIFSYFFSVILSRELTKPITELKTVMGEVLAGDLSIRYKGVGADETVFLGKTFNTLLDSANSYIEEIKHSVKLKNEAEIKFLQSQINPHLLYNTLDSAQYFISQEDNAAAAVTVEELSKFFKLSLSNDSLYVTLATELHHIRCYMELQRICRGKEIELNITGDENLKRAGIVKTTLQPIVENIYLHAFEGRINDGEILIGLNEKDGDLKITITDDGVGIEDGDLVTINEELNAEVKNNDSFGLWNVNRRLKACYGNQYGLSIESEFGEYTRVIVLAPINFHADLDHGEKKDEE